MNEMTLIVKTLYLLGAVFFILGLKGLSSPKTAVRGNLTGAFGMVLAIVGAVLQGPQFSFIWVPLGGLLGILIGVILALTVDFKAMPQLVGLFNGFGGIASVLVAASMIVLTQITGQRETPISAVATAATGIVGAVTFWGSLVAFAKLQGLISERPLRYGLEQVVKVIVGLSALAFGVIYIAPELIGGFDRNLSYWIMVGIASVLGLLLTLPIGGADMPIVIALLNSYSGIAAAASGFVLDPPNSILIIAGALVGASGIILTQLMCKAMNRSLANVLFGGVGAIVESAKGDDIYAGKIKSTSAEEIAVILKNAQRVVFVPGYGMAVGRAATPVRQLFEALEKDGITVEFGIHPVAGRMPGHMNVLLAEENIPYDKLKEMDEINPSFPNTDVTIVLGANDVVNPIARESQGTPISGMPILDVDKSRTVIVVKRSLAPGFAGIPNPLFANDNTLMFFADAKKGMEDVVKAYKEAD
jgi:NAD(P) transhydrogenase subunit beta